jgi:hypothetical protein
MIDVVNLLTLKEWMHYNPETGIFTWLKSPARNVKKGVSVGGKNASGYLRTTLFKKFYFLHRLAWFYVHETWPTECIDHINGKKSDNRICNLRIATHKENCLNRGKTVLNKSGHKGISWNKKDKRWKAQFCNEYIGYFVEIKDAIYAYSNYVNSKNNKFIKV